MGVVCFSSLKGGVGKTSLSVNVAHALAERGCETLLIDCDPSAHASRLFRGATGARSLLAELFFSWAKTNDSISSEALVERAFRASPPVVDDVRPGLSLVTAGDELRHFHWGPGARTYRTLFPSFIEELSTYYDYIVFDTAPDLNPVTRNALAASDLVLVPVDSSAMSIHSLEQLVESSQHLKRPTWGIIRSMVTKQAKRVGKLSEDGLSKSKQFMVQGGRTRQELDLEDSSGFVDLLNTRDALKAESEAAPIYLLDTIVYRTEEQNRLSFVGKTALDVRGAKKLAAHYRGIAREIEELFAVGQAEGVFEGKDPSTLLSEASLGEQLEPRRDCR